MHIEDSSACAVCADPRLEHIDAQRNDGATARQLAAAFNLDLESVFAHLWHTWSPPKRGRRTKLFRNSLRLDTDGTSAWLRLLPSKREVWTRVDVADLSVVRRFNWRMARRGANTYVLAAWLRGTRATRVLLHRLLLRPDPDLLVDHINHDTLDNRRLNLRVVTHAQNNQNRRGADRDSQSGIRGVSVYKDPKSGSRYWTGKVRLGRRVYARYFPLTDDGKLAAAEWVVAKRREVMPYSAADQVS